MTCRRVWRPVRYNCRMTVKRYTAWLPAAAIALLQPATAQQASQSARPNPLLIISALPYQAPPFDQIRDADYNPALDEGLKQELADTERIANNAEPPTFANTIEAMERSGALLRRVSRVFTVVTQSNTN